MTLCNTTKICGCKEMKLKTIQETVKAIIDFAAYNTNGQIITLHLII